MAFETIPAYLNKIPNRIVHSHNISCEHKVLNKILWPILKMTYTTALACSEEAGRWLFKKDSEYSILYNAINVEKYKFDIDSRVKIREELEIDKYYVIGHVGYFNEQKNHEKLFQVINCLKDRINIKLLCVSGDSKVPSNIKELVKIYNLENDIKILLKRNDVYELLKGMDLFIFPSKFEGLGLAMIEAQASGIHCIPSDKVPKGAAICHELIHYCELSSSASQWSESILKVIESSQKSRIDESVEAITQLRKSGYDIVLEAEKLRKIYMT